MKGGQLTRPYRITIQRATEAQDAFGEPIETWVLLATVWAGMSDLIGNERFQAQQVDAALATRFNIQYRDDVTAKMRLIHAGVTYNIEAPLDPDGRRLELILLCSRSAN